MTTSLSSNENIARGSWSKTLVSRTNTFLPPFALLFALPPLSPPALGAVALDDDDDGLFDDFLARCCIPSDPTEWRAGAIDDREFPIANCDIAAQPRNIAIPDRELRRVQRSVGV